MSAGIGYNSRLHIVTEAKNGQTTPKSTFFSAPYKLANYFRLNNGGIEYILMNASAGIMARDNYFLEIEVGNESHVVLSSQSFEKIHKMVDGTAKRETRVKIGKQAYFKYIPLPTIPFAESNFNNVTTIHLQDVTAKLSYLEILSCGRHLRGERFKYKLYKSLIDIYQMDKLVFKDNSVFESEVTNLEGLGMFEGYTHLANLILFGFFISENSTAAIAELFSIYKIDGGVTALLNGGCLIRALANESEVLMRCFQEIIFTLEAENHC